MVHLHSIILTFLVVITGEIILATKMTETFTGIPAPEFLPDDPWFGPAIYSKKQQDYMIDQLVKENLIILENNGSEELDNIHEIMYNLSTRWKMSGGSEKVWQ